MGRKLAILISILLLVVGLDQVTKVWVVQGMPLGGQIPIIPGFFNLVHVRNRGAAFGLLGSMSQDFTRIFFAITTILVIVIIAYLWWRTPASHLRAATGYSLILAGAVGNLIDRLRLGEVIDFLDLYYGAYHWPAFNVADSMVCGGAAFLVWVIFQEEKNADVSSAS
ncbi:MAG: signal peptidase II [Deltaproteobacteria bacterium]|nr:signal peptidase II [Deltaproteobacteria bacterium]